MTYRDYQPADFPALCDIDRLCFPPGIAYSAGDMAGWLRLKDTFTIVAEEEQPQRIAGFVLARKGRGRDGHIITIDIHPDHRRGGLGRELMERAEERLRKLGAVRVRLETSVENHPAIRFYEKLGYEAIARIPRYYLNRIDAWQMAKQL